MAKLLFSALHRRISNPSKMNHHRQIHILCLVFLAGCCFVAGQQQTNEVKPDTATDQDFEELGLHYGKYLKDVVAALDKDHKFIETIKNMDADDIKSGKVADQLVHVHEDVRKKLNELKYLEIKRLRDLAIRKNEMEQYGETYHGTDKRKWRTLGTTLKDLPEHLGSHATFFDKTDLHKLMVAATNDLEKLDKERKEDFKTYEMEKEWQFQERLKMMNETEKQEAMKVRQQLNEKHNEHPKVHEPGTRSQFEEVWEKGDNLPKQEFDPKTFFSLHDGNSDNYWDPEEVKQLLKLEISKLYDPNNPEDDPNEMAEEYERMREHIYKEIDDNHDQLISIQEFVDYSKKPEFRRDHGWDDLRRQEAYSKNEYEEYMKNRDKMMREMHGHYDPSYYPNQPSNLHLPNWGYGMPAGAHPAQYYGYQVDPNHPQAQQILAQQQHMAYQQQAAPYQHPAYQQPPVAPQVGGYANPQVNQQYYQQPPVQGQNQYQQKPNGQVGYQPPPPQQQQQQAPPPQQQQQQQPQPPPPQQQQPQVNYQQNQPPLQAPPAQVNYQQSQQPAQAQPVMSQPAQPQASYQQPPVQQQQPPQQQQSQPYNQAPSH